MKIPMSEVMGHRFNSVEYIFKFKLCKTNFHVLVITHIHCVLKVVQKNRPSVTFMPEKQSNQK